MGTVGGERQIINVANATAGTDAVNLNQMNAGDAATLASANSYTNTQVGALRTEFNAFQVEVWDRFEYTDARINKSGAMQSAMSQMSASAAGINTTNRFAVGVGMQGGKSALALGFQRAIGDTATFTFGGAIANDESTIGMGYGIGW